MSDVPAHRAWYREPYVWLIIAFPLAAVIAGIITFILAIQSDSGLVVDDYYRKGLAINRTLERDRRALHYELVSNLQYAEGDEQVRLILTATADFSYPDEVKISFLNASRDGLDKQQVLTRSGRSSYLGPNPELARGKWYIMIEADDWRLMDVTQIP